MSELTLDALSAADRARINVRCLAAQPRTREQCQTAMLRFHPACKLADVQAMLDAAGYRVERTSDGVTWIVPA